MRVFLNERSLLKISGSDAETFLQSQLSNDITKLDRSRIQINAYCQHQGKIIGLLWVIRKDEAFFISFPKDLLETIKSRFLMFVMMSDVVIEDVSLSYNQIGAEVALALAEGLKENTALTHLNLNKNQIAND